MVYSTYLGGGGRSGIGHRRGQRGRRLRYRRVRFKVLPNDATCISIEVRRWPQIPASTLSWQVHPHGGDVSLFKLSGRQRR